CELPVHAAVAGLKASAGHAPLDPVQLSATSHWPAEARQTVTDDLNASLQVVASVPEQCSAASSSQTPPCELPVHAAVAGLKASAGHAPLDPVQLSATSHWPAEARQVVAADLKASLQVVALVPEQWRSAARCEAPDCRLPVHAAVAGLKLSAGHAPLDPVQHSATSH